MTEPTGPGPMLFARLHVLAPEARVVLLASSRSDMSLVPVAESLAAAISATGGTARSVEAGSEGEPHEGYTVIAGKGVLDDPQTVLSSAAADAIVLVAKRGKSSRVDLRSARTQVESLGGALIGAVLLP